MKIALPGYRAGFFLVALACTGAMAFALFAQYVMGLEPCPLCIFQRVAVIAAGLLALIAALTNPGRTGARVWAVLVSLAALAGGAVSVRHVWLQSLPADQVPACGPGLSYMLETMPMATMLGKVLKGSGECAKIDWTLFGQSMPFWTGVFFAGIIVWVMVVAFGRR